MSSSFAELLAQNRESIVSELARMAKERAGPSYAGAPLEQLIPRMSVVVDALYGAISQDRPELMDEFTANAVRQRVQERYALDEIQALLSSMRLVVLGKIDTVLADQPEAQRSCTREMEDLLHRARQNAFDCYLEAFEERVEAQRRTLAELSTPVIKIYENVLVLPLVGAIDTERAHRIMEELLLGITRHQAELLIIDITGVPIVDTAVANHLMQTIKAARLLGAHSILVGISSEVAQALVHLQIDLSSVATRSNLQAGIEYALEQMGLEIAPQTEVLHAEALEEPVAKL